MTNFKDNFSKQSDVYLQHRPTYPSELFDYLASLTNQHELAWDCGTGNGQAAHGLIDYYEKIYAMDASHKQIENAVPHDKITYTVSSRSIDPLKELLGSTLHLR